MFYVFEGIDGCGKSTQSRRFAAHLRSARGLEVVEVREPGGTVLGEKLRDLLLSPETGELAVETELFLFMAARAELCRRCIAPALEAGKAVVADRFYWSTAVYQGIVGGLGAERILDMGRFASSGVQPRQTFVIDIDPEVGFGRLSGEVDRMEERGLAFQRRVRDGYLELARSFPGDIVLVDGAGNPEEVQARVLEAFEAAERDAPGRLQ